jgi:hypothetical protein
MRENGNGYADLLRWRDPKGHGEGLTSLLIRLEAKDPATAAHSRAVQAIAEPIATAMGVDIGDAGLVHDLGKLDVPPPLLQKRGPLTVEQFKAIKEHSRHGYRLLHRISPGLARIVMMIHERPDGTGYPFGVREVPVEAGIIAAAIPSMPWWPTSPIGPGGPSTRHCRCSWRGPVRSSVPTWWLRSADAKRRCGQSLPGSSRPPR